MSELPQMVEDEGFAYGGYARIRADALIEGDGVRLGVDGPCWLVEMVKIEDEKAFLVLTDRRVHVARTVSGALGRHVDGADDDPEPHFRVLHRAADVWMRM